MKIKESRYNIWVERDNFFYVYNGISGQTFIVSKEDHDVLCRSISEQKIEDCSTELIFNLAQRFMLIEQDIDELKLLENRFHNGRFDTSIFSITVVTSLGCNFDCPYCFEAKHPSIMQDEVQQAVLQLLEDQLPKIKKFDVTWFGGEPLVGKKPLLCLSDAFIKRCNNAGVIYNARIYTNGYLLDEETCKQLSDRKVGMAQITLDGPPKVHNQMRPLGGGQGSFWGIVRNLHHAVNYLDIVIRVNINTENFRNVESLFEILAAEEFADKLTVYPGHLISGDYGPRTPSSTYKSDCFTNSEFAHAEVEFVALAKRYGLTTTGLPKRVATPCTAVRSNELVVGSKGEIYKCPHNVGNPLEVIGDIRDYLNLNGRIHKWLKYDPFNDEECRSCLALPVCMGGCAQHAMDPKLHENRCDTFRHTYREQIVAHIEDGQQTRPPTVTPVKITRREGL